MGHWLALGSARAWTLGQVRGPFVLQFLGLWARVAPEGRRWCDLHTPPDRPRSPHCCGSRLAAVRVALSRQPQEGADQRK